MVERKSVIISFVFLFVELENLILGTSGCHFGTLGLHVCALGFAKGHQSGNRQIFEEFWGPFGCPVGLLVLIWSPRGFQRDAQGWGFTSFCKEYENDGFVRAGASP